MEKFNLQPHFAKQQLLRAFSPDDLTAMQRAFNQLCADGALCPDNDMERENLAKAIMSAYDSKMDEATLLAVASAVYNGRRSGLPGRAWADVQHVGARRVSATE